jgi:hypothetical protein
MRQIRFFEDNDGPKDVNDGRRLLIGIMDFDESPQVDGGRREAVRVATMADATEFQPAYTDYYNSFEGPAGVEAEAAAEEEREPLQPGGDPLGAV